MKVKTDLYWHGWLQPYFGLNCSFATISMLASAISLALPSNPFRCSRHSRNLCHFVAKGEISSDSSQTWKKTVMFMCAADSERQHGGDSFRYVSGIELTYDRSCNSALYWKKQTKQLFSGVLTLNLHTKEHFFRVATSKILNHILSWIQNSKK